MSILSIDPGLHMCGAALWEDNMLRWAGLIKNKVDAHPQDPTYHSMLWRGMVSAVEDKMVEMDAKPDRLALELPQVYVRTRSKGDPNDLILLTGLVGAFVQWQGVFTFLYKPHDWKGSVPKNITEERVKKRLSVIELSNIDKLPKSLAHNVWDGIGIGLNHLGR